MQRHPFTVPVDQDENNALCQWVGVPDGVPCQGGRMSKRHAGQRTIFQPVPPATVFGGNVSVGAGAGIIAELRYDCTYQPCDFYTCVPEKMQAHKEAHAMFIKEAPESLFAIRAFDSEAAAALIAHSEAVLALVREKDKAYGGAWKTQGYMGNLARIMSKAARLENMLWNDAEDGQAEDHGESVMDTLHDLMALCAFMATNIEEGNRWGR